MTRSLLTVTLALILAAPFAGLPGLAGVSPGAAWLGFGTVLLIVGLWMYADKLSNSEGQIRADEAAQWLRCMNDRRAA